MNITFRRFLEIAPGLLHSGEVPVLGILFNLVSTLMKSWDPDLHWIHLLVEYKGAFFTPFKFASSEGV